MRTTIVVASLIALLALPAVPARAAAGSAVQRTIAVDGMSRTYLFYRPASLATTAKVPLVVVLHGYGGNGAYVAARYGWNDEADAAGFEVAYPDGYQRSWNSGNCCGAALIDKVNDVKFLANMVAQIENDDGADPRRIYFAGMSNGAFMSYRMACEAPFPIAAIAPVAGTLDADCPFPKPTSLIAVNGSADPTVPYAGGRPDPSKPASRIREWQDRLLPVRSAVERWRALDDCGAPNQTIVPPATIEVATCSGGRAVESILMDGGGHQWRFAALDTTHTIWQFFASKVGSPAPR